MATGSRQVAARWVGATSAARPRPLLERRRLLEVLRRGRHRPLAVIHAPAGYGKTTLAVQWTAELRAECVRTAWLALGPDDGSLPSLIAHLLGAVRHALPELDAPLSALGAMLEQRPETAKRHILPALLREIDGRPERLVVVCDDWHLADGPEINAAALFALEHAPANLSAVFTSRVRPSLPLSRLRVRDQLTEIGPQLLRFDTQESQAFLVDVGGLSLASADLARLARDADGWVAALQLASLSLREHSDPSGLIARLCGRHHAIGEYLAENVLDTLPADVLEVLLSTAVCDRLCAGLVTRLTGEPDGQAVLEDLQRRDLFLRPLDDEHEWFGYHHLFADQLRRRLERDRPGAAAALHASAAAWFAEKGLVSEAVDHALAGKDVARAVQLVQDHAMPLLEHSRMTSVLGLIGKLPPAVVDANPHLLAAVAWANCLLQRPTPAQLALDTLRAELASMAPAGRGGSHRDYQALAAEANLVQACIDLYADRVDRAAELIRTDPLPNSCRPFLVAATANIQSFLDLVAFRFDAALARQQWAQRHHRRTLGPFTGVYGRCVAGLAALAQLDLRAAERHLHAAVSRARDSAGEQSHAAHLAAALLGELHYERGDLDTGARLLEESRMLGAESGIVDFMLASFGTLARVRAVQGDPSAAFALLAEGRETANRLGLPRLEARMISDEIDLLVETGQIEQALRRAQALPDGSLCHDGIATIIEWTRTATLARVLSAQGNHAAAIGLLEALVERTMQAGHPLWEVRARLRLAAAQQAGRFLEQAERAIAPALRQGARAGLHRTILDGGPQIRDVLARMCQAAHEPLASRRDPLIPPDYLAKLLAPGPAQDGRTEPDIAWAADAHLASLSGQEMKILDLLERGLSNKDIAGELRVSVNTVKWYLKNIYAKLGVTNRAQSVFTYRHRYPPTRAGERGTRGPAPARSSRQAPRHHQRATG